MKLACIALFVIGAIAAPAVEHKSPHGPPPFPVPSGPFPSGSPAPSAGFPAPTGGFPGPGFPGPTGGLPGTPGRPVPTRPAMN